MEDQGFSYTTADATALAQEIAAGRISPAEAVDEAFAAIARVNPRVNAVICEMREQAAEQLATLPAAGALRGVPVLLKDDCPSFAGAPMSFGCRAAEGHIPDTDHEIVARYRAAGLIVVGKTNLPEMSCNVATESTLHGVALNPWDAARTVGGSSGGSAAAVATGMVPIAYANDGAGSIRIPASCTGLFGLRPSRGRVPTGPSSAENWGGLVSHHALTRSVRDSALMLDLTSAPEPGAMYAAPAQEGTFLSALSRASGPLRIGLMTDSGLEGATDSAVANAVHETAELLRRLGHRVEDARPDYDAPRLAQALKQVIAGYIAVEIDEIAASFGKPQDSANFEPANLAMAEYGRSLSAPEVLAARNILSATARSYGRFFADFDLLLTPVMPCLPPPVGYLDARSTDGHAFAGRFLEVSAFAHPANAAGIPAMSLPLGQTPDGLPIGVQVLAPYGHEARLLTLAAELEREAPWAARIPPLHA